MMATATSCTIGRLADAAGVNVETIRFYQRRQLLPTPVRRDGGIRRYSEADLRRVRFIRSVQRLGFSLDEVAELLKLQDGAHCSDARVLAEHKLADVRARLADLSDMEAALMRLVAQCRSTRGAVTCPLIASLQSGGIRRGAGRAGA